MVKKMYKLLRNKGKKCSNNGKCDYIKEDIKSTKVEEKKKKKNQRRYPKVLIHIII